MSDSNTAGLTVERAGPQALVQDGGRFGVRHLGVTQGGALDWVSLGWANALLGNPPDTAGIEIVVGGLSLRAEASTCLAIAGGDLGATLDGERVASYTRFVIEKGQVLAFDQPRSGLRAYLALPGGIDAEPFMGSRSSVVREQLGGLEGTGRALAVGDRLCWQGTYRQRDCEQSTGEQSTGEQSTGEQSTGEQSTGEQSTGGQTGPTLKLPSSVMNDNATGNTPTLALVAGAQIGHFEGASLFAAFNQTWQVDSRADRMGVRLIGPELRCQLGGMISEGIPLGAVQVPPDGQPIILLNDRQTVGGYPRLGALSPLACAQLAQCAPGMNVRLEVVSPWRARQDFLRQYRAFNGESA